MKKLILLILIAFSFLSFNLSYNKEDTTYVPFCFVHITDPQFGFVDPKNFTVEAANFEKTIAKVNQLKPKFIVITGDMVNHLSIQAQIDKFNSIYQKLDTGIAGYLVAGNHDVKTIPTENTLNTYRKIFGKDWYSYEFNGWKFIVLNTSIIKNSDSVTAERDLQLSWLKNELATTPATEQIMVFQHYPFYLKTPDEADNYYNFPITQRSMYLELLNQYNVKAVFTGHTHSNLWQKYKNVTLITTVALCKSADKNPPGVRIVKVYKEHYTQTYYPIDSIPSTITY